jgi:hypothetical protein
MKKSQPKTLPSTMLDAALELLDRGCSILPVQQATKKPYLKSWKEYQTRLPTEEEVIKWWEVWPNANIAIITGKISDLLVVDADGPMGIQWINDNLPRTSVYSTTGKGCHAYFRYPKNAVVKNMVRLAPEVDIRGEGGYVVCPPSIHSNGTIYKWQLLLDGWDDLAEYMPPTAKADPLDKKGLTGSGNLNMDLTGVKLPVSTDLDPVAKGERNNTLAQLAGRWIGKGLEDAEVEALARIWNAQNSPPLGEKELKKTIWSIKKTHAENNPVANINECTNLQPEGETPEEKEIPSAILRPGGLIEEIMEYIDERSAAAVPYFSLAAGISLIGNIIGHRVATETGLRTNMLCICLGYSGSGKSAPINAIKNVLTRTLASNTIGITELTSAPAIFKELSLENKRITLLLLDEIGLVLSGLKTPNHPAREVPRLLMKLFSNTTDVERKSFAQNDDIVIPYSHLSLYGASTPDRFYESISGDELSDGFLARILLFESHHDAPYPKKHIKRKIPQQLIDKINALHPPIVFDTTDGNLMGRKPKPKIISMTDEADQNHERLKRKYHDLKNRTKADGFGKSTIYGRAAEHASKLALIHTISTHGTKASVVELLSIEWAWALVEYIIENTVVNIRSNVAESRFEKQRNRILQEMRTKRKQEKFKDGLTARDISRGPCRRMNIKEVKEIINTMLTAGEIGEHKEKANNNHEIVRYFLAKQE